MFILVLNQTNLVQDGSNNKLIYRFPNSVVLTNKYIAVSSISMFYSWDNISEANRNNTLYYSWGSAFPKIPIVIPDGLYEIAQLNEYLQFVCIQNGTYWYSTGATTTFYYPFQLIVNATRYAIQLNTFQIPSVGAAGFVCGSGSLVNAFPASAGATGNYCSVTFPPNFNLIVGYTVNPLGFTSANDSSLVTQAPTALTNYATVLQGGGTISYLSNTAPQVQPNSNLLFSMSNINNPYSQPSSIIYSLSPSVAIGQQIIVQPPQFMWNKLIDGTYNELRLTFLGTDLRPVAINDPNMTILLCIRDKDENFMASK